MLFINSKSANISFCLFLIFFLEYNDIIIIYKYLNILLYTYTSIIKKIRKKYFCYSFKYYLYIIINLIVNYLLFKYFI